MRIGVPLIDNDPLEIPQRFDILPISQHRLNQRTVFEFHVDRERETH